MDRFDIFGRLLPTRFHLLLRMSCNLAFQVPCPCAFPSPLMSAPVASVFRSCRCMAPSLGLGRFSQLGMFDQKRCRAQLHHSLNEKKQWGMLDLPCVLLRRLLVLHSSNLESQTNSMTLALSPRRRRRRNPPRATELNREARVTDTN